MIARYAHWLLVTLLIVLAVSCEGGNVECTVDSAFTPGQRAQIERAADVWNGFTTRKVRVVENGEWLVLPALTPTNHWGYAQRGRALIRIHPLTPEKEVYAVALHEIGHALGLGHVNEGVMDPERQTIEFSQEDFDECRRVGAC